MGIIDTLSAGFDRITKRLWLILIPVLVDIGIWIGPKLSINQLTQEALAALPSMTELGSQYEQSLELAREFLASMGAEANLLSLLSMRLLGLPSLTATFTPQARLFVAEQPVMEIQTWPTLLGLVLLFILLSLLFGCFCFSWLAQEARDEEMDITYALQVTGRSWLRLTALLLFGSLAAGVLLFGLSFALGLLAALSPQIGALLVSVSAVGFLWVSVYASIIFFFTTRAMILDNMGVLSSIWSSVNIVQGSFFSVVGFILLINIIQTGLMYIWRLLAVSTAGTLASILGNAYVSTGLVLASLIFYRDKFVAWQGAMAQARTGEG